MAPRILLLTTVHWPSTARLAGAFAGVGAHVEAFFPQGHVCGQSRYLSRGHVYSPYFPQASLTAAIAAARPDLIVPCDDRALALLLNLNADAPNPATASVIARSLGTLASYRVLLSRSDFIGAARTAGIAAPPTVAIASEGELQAQLARLGLPAVLKADGTWGGAGVAIVRDAEAARAAFRKLSAPPSRTRSLARAALRQDAHFLRDAFNPPRLTVSLQRFVPGTPATSAFACWKGRVLASIHMDVLESQGATGPASVMRRSDCPHMEQAAVRIAARFGLSGLQGLDFVRDGDGLPHLIEINPRATQASAFALGPGRDLAAALAACVSSTRPVIRPTVTEKQVIALFPQEWRRDPSSGWLHSAYPDVPWDDPAVLLACLEPGQQAPGRMAEPQGETAALTLRQATLR